MLRRRRVPGALALAVMSAMVVVLAVRAGGVTTEALVVIAQEQLGMTCGQLDPGTEQCTTPYFSADQWTVTIHPAAGTVTDLTTQALQSVAPLDEGSAAMMDDLHVATCADRAGIESFIARVGAMTESGSMGPQAIGTCIVEGDLKADIRSFAYTVTAFVVTPTPAASPTASPSPTPGLTPTPRPTPVRLATPSPTHASTESPSASPTPSPSPSAVPVSPPAETPLEQPEGQVAGVVGSPTPSGGGRPLPVSGLGFASSVAAPGEVRLDAAGIGASALLALLLLLFMAFPGELFNSTVESNYDEISGWLRGIRLGPLAAVWHGTLGVVLLLALGALTYSLLDPGFGADASSLASYIGMLAGLALVLVAFEAPGLVMHRRRTGELGALRALPWTLLAGAACVLISRLAGFEPGYLYGVLLGVVFRRPQPAEDEGRQAAAGALWTLLVAVAAWLALGWLRANVGDTSFLRVAGETALAAVVVAGLEAVAFGMMPFRFLGGAAVREWNRLAWALLFGAGLFAFVHVLIGPQSGYLADLAPSGLVAALAVFVAFAVFSFGVWGYFRYRPVRE